MIFVALGTQDKSFTRLLDIVEEGIKSGVIKQNVVVQSGYTKYYSENMEIYDYMSMEEFNSYIKKCDVFITHGGVGNILTGLKYEKKMIVVPRLSKYHEHTNDHQLQITNNFYNKGYILKLDDGDDIMDVLKQLNTFKPKKWVSQNEKLIKKIKEYIDLN